MKEIVYQNENYRSLSALARHFGYNYNALYRLCNKGYDIDEAIEIYQQAKLTNRFTVFGKTFRNSADICHYYKLNYALYASLLRKGVSLEDAIVTLQNSSTGRDKDTTQSYLTESSKDREDEVTFRKQKYSSKYALCREFGIAITYANNIMRSNRVLTWERAFDLLVTFYDMLEGERPVRIDKTPLVIYNGTWFFNEKRFAMACGIKPSLFSKYVKAYPDLGYLQVMEAIKKELHMGFEYQGKLYEKQADLEHDYGNTLRHGTSCGKITRPTVLRYPECTFEETGYTIDSLKEFEEFKETYIGNYLNTLTVL